MKLLLENWRQYLNEEEVPLEINTIGDLRKQIGKAQMAKRAKQGEDAVTSAATAAARGGIVTALGGALGIPLGTVATVGDLVQKAWNLPDDKKTGTGMDYLQVDDEISAIVSDDAENNFLNSLSAQLKELPDETPLKNIDVNKLLQNFLYSNYNQRTVTGPDL